MSLRRYLFAARNVADKLRKVAADPWIGRFYLETYLLRRFSRVQPDLLLVSYPKCGRTWVRMLLQSYGDLLGQAGRDFLDKQLVQVAGRIVRFDHDQGSWVPAPRDPARLSFRHDKYEGRKVIFLVRDPRDVLVSSWYHLRYRESIYRADLSTFVRDELLGVQKVIAFMNMFLDNAHVPAEFLLITYEDLHQRPEDVLSSVLQLMKVEVRDELLGKAIEASSFERMRKLEKDRAVREPWMRPGARTDQALKVRQGKVGSHRKELAAEDIAYLDEMLRNLLHPNFPYSGRG